MDDTWQSVLGTKVEPDGKHVRLGIETVDFRGGELRLKAEIIPGLIAELVNAHTQARLIGSPSNRPMMSGPSNVIAAEKVVRTNQVNRGRSLVQVLLDGGGVLEFAVKTDPSDQEGNT